MEHIFRAYDIRGVFNEDLTVDVAARIAETFAALMGHRGRVAVGRDVRVSSVAMESAVLAGVVAGGMEAIDVGACPIPVLNFHVWSEKCDAGIYITASHNPPEYNGIRFRNPDGSGWTGRNEELKAMFLKGPPQRPPWKGVGRLVRPQGGKAAEAYMAFLRGRVTAPRRLKVVVDPGNGAATLVAPELLRRVGHEVVVINGEVDGTFPNRSPHPTEGSLGALMEAVVREHADLGVGYDGDGDRCVFVDDLGRVVQVEKAGILLARDALKVRKGKVIVNVPCSMMVEDELAKDGAEVARVRVGDVFVCEAVKRLGGVFAMEISAHYFLPQYYIFDDPILATLKLIEVLGRGGVRLSEAVDAMASYPFVEEELPCPDDVKFRVNELLLEHFRARGARIDTTDGVKVIYEDGWAMLRPSNTQPLTRLFAEARTRPRMEQLVAEFKRVFAEKLAEANGTAPSRPAPKGTAMPEAKPNDRPKASSKPEPRPKPGPKAKAKPKAKPKPKPQPKPGPKTKPKAKPKAKPQPKPGPKTKPEPKPQPKPRPKPQPKPEPRPRPKAAPMGARRRR